MLSAFIIFKKIKTLFRLKYNELIYSKRPVMHCALQFVFAIFISNKTSVEKTFFYYKNKKYQIGNKYSAIMSNKCTFYSFFIFYLVSVNIQLYNSLVS